VSKLSQYLAFSTLMLSALSCGKAPDRQDSESARRSPSSPTIEQPAARPSTSGPAGAPDATRSSADWQSVTIRIETSGQAKAALVGYDQVSEVLARKEYGSCYGCHAKIWPYLSKKDGWPRFLESLNTDERPEVKSLAQLAAVLVGSVSPEPAANGIAQMPPNRPGLKPLSKADLKLLQDWQSAGALAQSQVAHAAISFEDLREFKVVAANPAGLQLKANTGDFVVQGKSAQADIKLRLTGGCTKSLLQLALLSNSGQTLAQIQVPVFCRNGTLVTEEKILL
jgi:hypothetical protein